MSQVTIQKKKPRRTNRNRYDIEYEILALCQSPKMKTHVMYKVNLSFAMVQKYLHDMYERSLLEPVIDAEAGHTKWLTTQTGRKLMVAYLSINRSATKEGGETI